MDKPTCALTVVGNAGKIWVMEDGYPDVVHGMPLERHERYELWSDPWGRRWWSDRVQRSRQLLTDRHAWVGWLHDIGTVAVTSERPLGDLLDEWEYKPNCWRAVEATDRPNVVRVSQHAPWGEESAYVLTDIVPYRPLANCNITFWTEGQVDLKESE